jgi:hypothetical protein
MAERRGFSYMMRTLKMLLAALGVCAVGYAGDVLAGPGTAVEPPEQTAPQGEDPPGADNGKPEAPVPEEHKGVIPPPDIGDEDIHTEVPNPEAGHEEEVIPPSEVPPQALQQEQQPPR